MLTDRKNPVAFWSMLTSAVVVTGPAFTFSSTAAYSTAPPKQAE